MATDVFFIDGGGKTLTFPNPIYLINYLERFLNMFPVDLFSTAAILVRKG